MRHSDYRRYGLQKELRGKTQVILELPKGHIGHHDRRKGIDPVFVLNKILNCLLVDRRCRSAKLLASFGGPAFSMGKHSWKIIFLQNGERSMRGADVTVPNDLISAFVYESITYLRKPAMDRRT